MAAAANTLTPFPKTLLYNLTKNDNSKNPNITNIIDNTNFTNTTDQSESNNTTNKKTRSKEEGGGGGYRSKWEITWRRFFSHVGSGDARFTENRVSSLRYMLSKISGKGKKLLVSLAV